MGFLADAFHFIHIPKTGGTSLEIGCPRENCINVRRRNDTKVHSEYCGGRGSFSPWHIPPDRYRACYGAASIVGPTLCVVRNPHDRLVSELAWEQRLPHLKSQWLTLDTRRLYTFWRGLAQGNPHLNFYEIGLHLLPQRFFVHMRGNRSLPRTCDCVVAFEKLALLTSRRLNPSLQHNETALNISLATRRKLWGWYAEDWTLWRRARASKQLCMN